MNVIILWIAGCRLFGLCNNFAYVIMISAAHDILMPKADVRTDFFLTAYSIFDLLRTSSAI